MAAVQEADQWARAVSSGLFPAKPRYDSVSVLLGVGGPLASYHGSNTDGNPQIRIDTASARFWRRRDVYRVTAHEVWPGHHMIATETHHLHPIVSGLRSHSFMEGWATYVETVVVRRAGMEAQAEVARHLGHLALLAQVDIGLGARHWSRAAARDTLRAGASYSTQAADALIQEMVQNPARQAAYYLGYFSIRSLRERMMASGSLTLSETHGMILQYGPIPISILRKVAGRQNLWWDPRHGVGGSDG